MEGHMRKAIAIPLVCSLLLLALGACVSPEEVRRRDEAQCLSYGFKPGTTDFANCLQRENLARHYGYAYSYPYFAYAYSGYP